MHIHQDRFKENRAWYVMENTQSHVMYRHTCTCLDDLHMEWTPRRWSQHLDSELSDNEDTRTMCRYQGRGGGGGRISGASQDEIN